MPTLYDTLNEYPSESLTYDKQFEIDDIDFELEHNFHRIDEITSDDEKSKLLGVGIDIGLSPDLDLVKIFLITNEDHKTCKFAVWGD